MSRYRASSVLAAAVLGLGAAPALALPGGWSAPTTLSAPTISGLQPAAAANVRGDRVVAWRARSSAGEVVQVARRPRGATAFGAPITIGPPRVSVQGVRVAIGFGGRILVGWRAKNSASTSTVFAATIPTALRPIRIASFPGALDGSGPVNVTITPSGLAAAAWIRRGPSGSVGFTGRARIAIALPGQVFGADRALRTGPGGCPNESGVDLASRNGGGVLAWWDCDDDVRDFEALAAQISPTGVIGAPEDLGSVSRGPTNTALQPALGGSVLGFQGVNNDDDAGPNARALVRTAAGAWTAAPPTIAGPAPDPNSLGPHVIGPARIAAASGIALSAWIGDDQKVVAMTGSTAATVWNPAVGLLTSGDRPLLAGVGVSSQRSQEVVFSTRETPGPSRTVWVARRLATDAAFALPEDALHISPLTGTPVYVLGKGGQGVLVYSEGPTNAARVRAVAVTLP